MSFRLRVLALVSLVAVTAVGATAYLAFVQASRQVTLSAAADLQTVELILHELTAYARSNGTWQGVPRTVRDLSKSTGQRIKLISESGTVVVDTDTLEGRTARGTTGPPIVVDARPRLNLPTGDRSVPPDDTTLGAIRRYRFEIRLAACLTRKGLGVNVRTSALGVPQYEVDARALRNDRPQVTNCEHRAASTDIMGKASEHILTCKRAGLDPAFEKTAVTGAKASQPPDTTLPPITKEAATTGDPEEARYRCLEEAFTRWTADVAPPPLRMYLGFAGASGPRLAPRPVIAAAALVALLAIAGTALLSRRVLRPIGTLIAASQQIGEGDLSRRVPVSGRDELAELARSFNRMADSLQHGEERQHRLVADVAHELRTPLANLRGYLEALKDGVIPADPELFASLHEEAILQQRIVDDLQDLALAEAGALAYHRTTTDLAELLETCRTAHQPAADAARVALLVRAPRPVPVNADPDRLRQVIGNLVANALRATPAGGTVTLQADGPTSGPTGGGWATIEVSDTGVGIAAEDLPHVFDRFWRQDRARSRSTGGSGLGLAIARQIVTDHGGRIAARSQLGTGTTIEITLPAGNQIATDGS